MKRSRGLRDVLFRLPSPDDQLILAVTLCLTDLQSQVRSSSESVLGVMSRELWDWLQERTADAAGHPNIDYHWTSLRAVQAALRRLQRQGLLRASPADYSGALVWCPTPEARAYLRERRLFADDDDRLAG